MPSILECNRIVGSVYPYSLNFATLFASHLSSILALFFSKSLVKLLLHDGRSSILTQVLLFHQLFHCQKSLTNLHVLNFNIIFATYLLIYSPISRLYKIKIRNLFNIKLLLNLKYTVFLLHLYYLKLKWWSYSLVKCLGATEKSRAENPGLPKIPIQHVTADQEHLKEKTFF